MQCPSSGSTGDPKIIEYTHRWMKEIGQHCIDTFGWNADDRVLHLSNLHHGGSSGCFFFPTLKACREHYFDNGVSVNRAQILKIVDLIVSKKITRVMFPTAILLDGVLHEMPKIDHRCVFYSLQANHRSWIQYSRKTGVEIISLFGASEVLGPIFINRITPQTDDTHDVLNYGKPLSTFYKVLALPEQLSIQDRTGRSATVNDIFIVDDNGDYHYSSRSDLIRINEVIISYKDLEQALRQQFDHSVSAIVAYTTLNKIYLLLDISLIHLPDTQDKINFINQSLSELDPILKIDYIEFATVEDFISGIKVDRQAVIDYFRQKFYLV